MHLDSGQQPATGRPTTDAAAPVDCPRRWRILALALAALLAGWSLVRPRVLNWGATPAETAATLPGDELLPDPDAVSTMAVDVEAPPGDVWPWLRQLGQGRGGFYSYEWAENLVGLDIHNADSVVPAWQDLEVGDEIRLGTATRYPDATLTVAAMDPERSLVLRTPSDPPGWVWSFVLVPTEGGTRLLVRSRVELPANPVVRTLARSALDPVAALMTRGMLLGVRSRAERRG